MIVARGLKSVLFRGRVAVTVLVVATAIAATASPVGAVAGFGDVAEDRFYAEPVAWMVDTGLTTGTEVGCFSPNDVASRVQRVRWELDRHCFRIHRYWQHWC